MCMYFFVLFCFSFSQQFLHTVLSDIERGAQASVGIPVNKPREHPLGNRGGRDGSRACENGGTEMGTWKRGLGTVNNKNVLRDTSITSKTKTRTRKKLTIQLITKISTKSRVLIYQIDLWHKTWITSTIDCIT